MTKRATSGGRNRAVTRIVWPGVAGARYLSSMRVIGTLYPIASARAAVKPKRPVSASRACSR